MNLTSQLPATDRERVEDRLRSNLIAWLTTVRPDGTARQAHDLPAANEHPEYLAKYLERMAALFGTPEEFARLFSAALIISPAKLHT